MANPYYQPGAERPQRVRTLFEAIAPRYDLVNDVQSFGLHRWWKRRLVELARVRPQGVALDLCCGTGDVTFALAGAGAEAIGVDFSTAMLEVARSKMPGRNTRTTFVAADALKIPLANSTCDVVTISYGLRNLADFEAGLREMWRVAQPGGRLLVLDFGKPDFAPWRGLYFLYLRLAVPCFGWLFHRNSAAYSYILESLHHYPAQHGVAAVMNRLGCEEVRIITLLGGVMTINCGTKPGRV